MTAALLTIDKLTVLSLANPQFPIIENISFEMGYEILGIVGASGSGKSITSRSILGLLPKTLKIQAEKLWFKNTNLLTNAKNIRGKEIGMVVQDPKHSLNPLLTIGYQISEMFIIHKRFNRKTAKIETLKLLNQVQLPDLNHIFNAYPHELSGGMAQRVMIAIMLAAEPSLLIADEATSALDKKTESEVIGLLKENFHKKQMGLLIISHDLELIERTCSRVLVMNQGKIVETCSTKALSRSKNDYTQKLYASIHNLKKNIHPKIKYD